jgi:WAS/WASL-interacting protein
MLWYTAGKQLSAFAVRVWNKPQPSYIGKYWTANADGTFDMIVSLRSDTSNICNSNFQYAEPLGDAVSNGGISIPVTEPAAQQAGWTRGACIKGMGTHYSLDVRRRNGTMSWAVDDFYPIMPMFHPKTKAINGVLIASTNVNLLFPFGIWEGPFPGSIFCMNWCKNTGCSFYPGTGMWSTVHWMFNDTKYNSCDGAICNTP